VNDVLYAIFGDGLLWRVDPTTAVATLIGDTGLDAGGGLAFIGPAPAVPVVVEPALTG
jgi:hypothetical protein